MSSTDPPRHEKRLANPDAPRPKHTKKEYDELVKAAWDAWWWCERGGNKHIKCFPPDGKRMVPVPATPSGARTLDNKRAQFRRSGLDV